MGYKHTREEILDGALAEALDGGLSQLTFGRLAKRLGINDRVIVYYFPTKDDLLTQVLRAMGAHLQDELDGVIEHPAADHRELVTAVWPLLATDDKAAFFALFFEALGLAAVGRHPFQDEVPILLDQWINWTATHIADTARDPRGEAESTVAVIDGLMLLRLVAGPHIADRAANTLAIT